jgi:threonylcarbamoyladenosine tRNA methylthiotransferase CDKAL1
MARVFVQTYGCSLNQSDSEVMMGVLAEHGYELVKTPEEADLLVINSCTVKSNPEQKLFYQIRNKKKPLVIAGCVPIADKENVHFKNVSIIGPQALSQIAFVVEETLKGKKVVLLDDIDVARNALPTIRTAAHIGIIPINAGCLSACSYCKTKQARGNLESYPIAAIEKQFRALINDGVKEIWLTSQDTGTYGLDMQTNLVSLLRQLLKKPGEYRIRLGMANPQFLIQQVDDLADIFQHENMFCFLHLPVQSGSNKVLKDMRRGYTKEMFRDLVLKLREKLPDVTIATDIIVGFPTETEDDFNETIALIEELKIPVVNISKFYPRPGTLAAKMLLLPTHIVKERSTALKRRCELIAAERNKSFKGKTLSVLVDEPGKKPGTMIARSDNYVQVILKEGKLGERKEVQIVSSGVFDVRSF